VVSTRWTHALTLCLVQSSRISYCCASSAADTSKTGGLAESLHREFESGSELSVRDRHLITISPTPGDILDNAKQYCAPCAFRREFDAHPSAKYSRADGAEPLMTLGYLTPWNRHGRAVAVKFARKFTHISPAWFQIAIRIDRGPTGNGKAAFKMQFKGAHEVDQEWIRLVRGAGGSITKIVPRFIVEVTELDPLIRLAKTPSLQKKFINRLQQELLKHNFDGAVLEMTEAWPAVLRVSAAHEAEKNRDALNQFVAQLGDALHSTKIPDGTPAGSDKRKELFLVIRPFYEQSAYFNARDLAKTAASVDGFSLMTYDFSHASPGPNSPLEWVRQQVNYWAGESKHETRRKILMGMPFYGYRFPIGGAGASPIVSHEYLDVLRGLPESDGKAIEWESESAEHAVIAPVPKEKAKGKEKVYYPTLQSISERVKLAELLGVGISIWELGQGLDYFYDLL
jgi:chitinase domain-containing protein 1